MEQSPRLSLSYVAPSQAQKHVTVNETFRRLDAIVQGVVLSRTVTAEPASPAEGDAFIIPMGASGTVWSAYDAGDLAAYQDGAWAQIAPFEGLRLWVADDDELVIYDGAAWGAFSGGGGVSETAAKFGINTTADATNKLAVKSDAILFSHDDVTPGSGDAQVKVNKAAAGNTASHLFQTNFSGRAEFGLTGDDDFHVKVSADGAAWTEAVVIDNTTGDVGFGTNAPGKKFHIVTSENNDGFILETSNAAGGRVGFDLLTQQSSNAGDFFRFNFRGDNPDVVLTVWDQSASAFHNWMVFDYLNDATTVYGGWRFGSPIGGAKGVGTINAEAVYDDNTLLSCYVFDQALDGSLDAAKWDGNVPDRRIRERNPETGEIVRDETVIRRHEPMRRFASRIGGEYDPLTLDGYAKHWKEKRHLTAMPNEAAFDPVNGQLTTGEWIQRLVETVEIQAVLIEELNSRVKAATPPGRR